MSEIEYSQVIELQFAIPAVFIESTYLPLLLLAALGDDFLLDLALLLYLFILADVLDSFVVRHGDCLINSSNIPNSLLRPVLLLK